jgi:hypothetical protein
VGRILGPHEEIGWFTYAGPTPRVDRARDRVTLGRRSAPTCREPVDATMYDSDRVVAVLCGRERVVQLFAAGGLRRIGSAPAGTGPARIASDGRANLYVTDTAGESLLVYHLHPRFELIRRVSLPGGPYAIAYDDARWSLFITLTAKNRVVQYAAGSRPVPLHSWPTVRRPNRLDLVGTQVLINDRQLFSPPRGRAGRTP